VRFTVSSAAAGSETVSFCLVQPVAASAATSVREAMNFLMMCGFEMAPAYAQGIRPTILQVFGMLLPVTVVQNQ